MKKTINSNWNQTILSRINAKNLDVYGILFELQTIERNLNNFSNVRNSFYNISNKLSVLFNELFPLVGYGYRNGIELRNIPREYRNVFEAMNRTITLYSQFKAAKFILEDEKSILIVKNALRKIRKERNFKKKGMKFGKFNRFLEKKKGKIEMKEALSINI